MRHLLPTHMPCASVELDGYYTTSRIMSTISCFLRACVYILYVNYEGKLKELCGIGA